MIFDVFHKKSKILSFSQKYDPFTIRQISKIIRKLTFSVLRDLLLAARRLRWTKATNSTKIAEIIRICVSDCQCEKLPFADFGIHNSKNVAVVRVRLWKLFLSCCVVHGTEQCITQNHNRVWSHSQSVTNPQWMCGMNYDENYMEIRRSSGSMFISSLGAESRHTHLLEALSHWRHCSKNIFWVPANRVLVTDWPSGQPTHFPADYRGQPHQKHALVSTKTKSVGCDQHLSFFLKKCQICHWQNWA